MHFLAEAMLIKQQVQGILHSLALWFNEILSFNKYQGSFCDLSVEVLSLHEENLMGGAAHLAGMQ